MDDTGLHVSFAASGLKVGVVDGPFNEVLAIGLLWIAVPERHGGPHGGVNPDWHVLLRGALQALRADEHRLIIHDVHVSGTRNCRVPRTWEPLAAIRSLHLAGA